MVATVHNLTSSSATAQYFRQDAGYYLRKGEDAADLRAKRAEHRNASTWHGQGAVALGLHPGKPVAAGAFEKLLQGHVIGTWIRLGRLRDGQREHRPGFDITFSAPKSVSLAALLPTKERPHGDRAVIRAHNAAVRETLDWIEGTLLETRGWDPATRRRPRVKAPSMVAALFRHIASRNLDPQLHTHAVIANMTRDEGGRWKSVEPTLLHRNARLIGAYYRDRLARQLIAKGYSILPAMVGRLPSFELAGYGRELREAFSTRRHEILAYVDGKGWDRGAAAMQAATLATRKRKAEPVRAQLQQRWRVRAQELGLDTALTEARSGQPIVLPEGPSALAIVRRCMRQLEERQSVFSEHDLEALALGHSPGRHSIGEIREAVAWLVRDGHLIEAELRRADRAFVTDRALKAERSTIAMMKAGIGAGEALAREKDVAAGLDGVGLTEEQEEAVRTILLARDRIVGVQGRAGTGKTTMLRQVRALAGNRPVIGLAPSTEAADVLGRETGIHARTLQWFLARCRAAGLKGEALERLKESFGGAVLVLDEASMVSTDQMRSLLRAADRLDVARVVLVGDIRQLRPVEAGQPFRLLQRAGMPTAMMKDIQRQRTPELRAAVRAQLQQRWRVRAQELGLDTALTEARSGQPIVLPEGPSALAIVRRCMRQLEERQSVFSEHDLEALALGHSPGRHSIGEIREAVAWLVRDGHLIEAELRRADRAFVTDRALKAERSTIAMMKAGIGAGEALAREKDVAAGLDGVGLTEEQEEAVRTILLARDRIVGVQGRAGTGKTTMLRQVRALAGNRPVIGLAPSTEAADVLGRETGIHARTLQWFLARCRAAGLKGEALERLKESFGGAVLVLDEASMVSTDQMRSLLRAADRLDVARVVLVGDIRQLRPVEAGQPFRLLQRAGMPTAMMKDIQRQRTPELRAAVQAVLAGDPGEAVALLGSSVHEVAHEELGESAARAWLALDPATRDNTLLVAPTHALREEINRTVRDALADEGVLRGKPLRIERLVSLGMTPAERGDRRNYREGDLVVFHQSLLNYRLKRDEILTVTGFDYDRVMLLHPDGKPRWFRPADSIRYRLDVYETRPIEIRAGDRIRWTRNDKKRSLINGGRAEVEGIAKGRVRFRLADGRGLSLRMDDPQLRHIDHAWSSTVHGAQGSTAEGVIAVLDSSYGALTDQSTFYVEISRARDRAVVLTDNAEELVKVLADNTGERPTAIEAVDAPLELEPEEIVRLLAEEEPVWSPRAEWEALERRARREGTVLFLVDGYGELIGGTRELAQDPDLPALTREVVDGLLAYDRACREGDRAAVEFLGLLDTHDARRRGLDGAATTAECPVAGLEDYPEWREMSGRLSANGKALLAELGGRAGEAGSTISRRLGLLADLLAVDDAVLDFDTLRREVAARAESDDTIPFYAEGHGDLVKRARELAELSPLPAWALAAVKEVLDQAEACKERKAEIVTLHGSATGLLGEHSNLEDRARTARRSEFTPPTELAGYADWLVRCGEVRESLRAMREDPDTWQPHLDRLKDEEGKIAAAVKRFDQLGDHDLAWARVFQERQTMREREKAGSIISFYQQGWKEFVEEARKLSQREGLPDQAGEMAQRVLDYDSLRSTERATVDGFFKDAEDHRQRRDPLEEEAKRRARQDPDFLVTDLPGYRSLPDIPKKLLTAGRKIHKDEDTYAPHLDQIPDAPHLDQVLDGRQKLAAALERMERHRLLDRFVSVMDRIEQTKPSAVTQGISPVGDEAYDQAIARADRLVRESDLEEAARRRLQAELDEHAALSIEWMTFQDLFREANEVDEQYRRLEERATRETLPLSLLAEWPAWQERSFRFEEDVQWALDDGTRERWQGLPDMLERIEQGLRHASERKAIPELEEDRIAGMVGAELARFRDPRPSHAFTRLWVRQEPLLAGERITLRLSDDGPQREAVVLQPGRTGGCARNDVVELEWVAAATGRTAEEPVKRMSGRRLAGCEVLRAEWSDERLWQAELERQWPEPPARYPLACSRDLTRGDRLWCSEVGGSERAAPESARLGRPTVVQIELEVVDRRAGKTEAEDHCTLRELWRSDDEPCQEFSLSFDKLTAFARWRAFWDDEDERWSKAQATNMELDEKRIELNQEQGRHHVMRP